MENNLGWKIIWSLEQKMHEEGKGGKCLVDGHTHRQTDNLKSLLEFWIQSLHIYD